MGRALLVTNKYLFANLLVFMSGEGNKAMLSSFAICYAPINTFSVSLEALIASLLPTSGTPKEAPFLIAIKLLIVIGSFFFCANGEWVTLPSCGSIGTYNHCCKHAFLA